jgi:hypothetical protein
MRRLDVRFEFGGRIREDSLRPPTRAWIACVRWAVQPFKTRPRDAVEFNVARMVGIRGTIGIDLDGLACEDISRNFRMT